MYLLIISCIMFFIWNSSMAKFTNFYSEDQCQTLGNNCQQDTDCCSDLTCYSLQNEKLCLSLDKTLKRGADKLIIPPYSNSKNHLHPYGINMPPFPVYNAYENKQSKAYQRSKMEWNHCQHHEDCGDNNCCYVHFRFRSLPKSFCRPNRNKKNELCEPLAKYHSLKDVPAWKQQINDEKQRSEPLRRTDFGR